MYRALGPCCQPWGTSAVREPARPVGGMGARPCTPLFGVDGGKGTAGGNRGAGTRAAAYLCVLPMFSRDLSVAAAIFPDVRSRE